MISSDGAYALSASWDKTLRLWELSTGQTTRRFVGHTNDVLSVSFSADNRQIVSGSRDRSIKLWNTLGDCKFTITEKGHTEWVSCVRFSPNPSNPVIVSAGWDRLVKVCLIPPHCQNRLSKDACNRKNKVFATSDAFMAMRTTDHQLPDDNTRANYPDKLSSFDAAADSLQRFGSSLRAVFRRNTAVTPATSTRSPSRQMDRLLMEFPHSESSR